jgi:hypothetical protein
VPASTLDSRTSLRHKPRGHGAGELIVNGGFEVSDSIRWQPTAALTSANSRMKHSLLSVIALIV